MKATQSEVGNGPVGKEDMEVDEAGRGGGGGGEEEEEEEEEELGEGDIEEYLKLDAELDALSTALDTLEQRNDSINSRLRKILDDNRAIREDGEEEEEEEGVEKME